MARQAQNNQQLSGTWTIAQNQTYFTMAFWGWRSGNGADVRVGAQDVQLHRVQLAHAGDNNIYAIIRSNDSSAGQISKTGVSGWNHYALVFDGTQSGNSNRLKSFFNGTQQTLSFTPATVPATTSGDAANQTFRINYAPFASVYGNGQYAEFAAWQSALDPQEIISLYKGFSPRRVRPDKLETYLPLVREVNDAMGHIILSNTNTTVADHPRIYG